MKEQDRPVDRGPVRGEFVRTECRERLRLDLPGHDDFRGIDHLVCRLGDDFVAGLVLYTGTETLAFGEKKRAVPVSALWELGH
ncbi:hypothetical protein [Tsukamurella pseudospumae]|uniref:DUF4143 domain-containing protein n=1 Tax=Tsukamurella pseudospumae TaxID=239498 RepID=A0A138ATU5_9ACTN|nr:hypothetical protein [Tsukamurella pseudospumae]KXP13806.1 hypothetical protein AXK60_23505 [Tsukamurella pseudospumae]